MSVIANFKKRREAAKANHVHQETAANTQAPKNEALALLAALLGCEQSEAIEQAKEFVELGCEVVAFKADLTDEQAQELFDKSSDEDKADTLSSAIESSQVDLTDATEKLESATSDLSDTSSDLAYNADDIASAAADIKEAAEEIKKPSAGRKSSPGAKKGKAKKSSKK